MRIRNARVLIGREFQETDLTFDRTITAIGPQPGGDGLDAAGCYVLPGLVDLHTHGAVGRDFSDAEAAGLQPMADYYAAQGVTSCLPTLMTLPEEALTEAVRTLETFRPRGGAKFLGVHLEGPFLSPSRHGAQPEDWLRLPEEALFRRLNASGSIRRLTLACELPGAMEFLRRVSRECLVSLGHSQADYGTAMKAFHSGAGMVTHLYNAMPPLLHRAPGLIGAAVDSGVYAELICDGLHVHPAAVRAAWRLFGERLILISDSLRCAGLGDGVYTLAGQGVTVTDGQALLADGTLAGSAISLLEAVRRAVRFGLPLSAAAYAASTAPARAIGAGDIGSIAVGRAADLLILDEQLQVVQVYIDGRPVEQSPQTD